MNRPEPTAFSKAVGFLRLGVGKRHQTVTPVLINRLVFVLYFRSRLFRRLELYASADDVAASVSKVPRIFPCDAYLP